MMWMDSAVKETGLRNWRGKFLAFGLLLPVLLTMFFQTAVTGTSSDVISRLVEWDGVVYAFDLTDNGAASQRSLNPNNLRMNLTARYDPDLDGWERLLDVRDAIFEIAIERVTFPLTACVPDNPLICYRIDGDERVLESDDGGESWETAWKVPAGRRLFMERAAVNKGAVDMGPNDLLVTGMENSHQVFVAMGNEGVLRRGEDGSWERQQVGNAEPTPFRATTLLEFLATVPAELFGWLLFVLIYGVGQYLFFLRRLRLILTPLTWAVLIGVFGSLLLLYALVSGGGLLDWGLLLLIVVLYTVPVFLAFRKWVNESRSMDDPEKGQAAGRIWMASTVGLLFGGMALLFLWPLGVLPFYWLMVLVVLGTAVGVAIWGTRRIYRLMDEAGYGQ